MVTLQHLHSDTQQQSEQTISTPLADHAAPPVELSVVLITRNQAWNVARLVESVLEQTAALPLCEIVLVDSDSSDATVEIAETYPINVIKLRPTQRLTAAAGRYAGCRFTTGTYVLFLDGDMELYPGWLDRALLTIRQAPEIAVVSGPWINTPPGASQAQKQAFVRTLHAPLENGAAFANDRARYRVMELSWSHPPGKTERVRQVGGAALYRRAVLDEVGSFNPYLFSDEEPELCMRIRRAGYTLLRLGHPIAYHYSSPPKVLSTFWRRHQHNLYLGHGQNLRYYLGQDLFWTYLRERGQGCLAGGVLLAGLAGLIYAVRSGSWRGLAKGALALLGAFGFGAFRKHSFGHALNSVLLRLFMLDGTVRGFLLKPMNPRSYCADFLVVKRMDGSG